MDSKIINLHELNDIDLDKVSLVDIRPNVVYQFGTIPGAVNIPATQMQDLYELPTDKAVYIFCQSGEISGDIAELLCDAGYDAYHIPDGYLGYLKSVLEQEEKNERRTE